MLPSLLLLTILITYLYIKKNESTKSSMKDKNFTRYQTIINCITSGKYYIFDTFCKILGLKKIRTSEIIEDLIQNNYFSLLGSYKNRKYTLNNEIYKRIVTQEIENKTAFVRPLSSTFHSLTIFQSLTYSKLKKLL